jgi:hypothetical protein
MSDMIKSIIGHTSNGNVKVPFFIINMNSATDCPSRAKGLCQAGKACYALKAEVFYKRPLAYRRLQEWLWENATVEEYIEAVVLKHSRKRKPLKKVLRFSEAGDFRTQADIVKMAAIAKGLKGWKVYVYTSRTDLDLAPLIDVKVYVNVSNAGGGWLLKGANHFKMVTEASGDNFVCVGDCRKCAICRNRRGQTIEVIKH